MAQIGFQRGHLYKKGAGWHVRWREGRRNRSQKIATLRDYPQKREVRPVFAEFMGRLSKIGVTPDAGMRVADFVEQRYFPWAEQNLAASTFKNYRQVWLSRLSHRIGIPRVRDVRPLHIEETLTSIVRQNPKLSKRTLQRAKALLSGIFGRAVALGLIDHNPVHQIALPRTREVTKDMYAYTPEEIRWFMANLPDPAKTIIGVAAYAGLTVSEIRGLQWTDYDTEAALLHVQRGVWRRTVGVTKTAARQRPVPVIGQLKQLLDQYRGSLVFEGTWMFSSSVGTPIDLANLATRVIRPALEGSGVLFRGYHAFRRALGTTLYSLDVPELIIQRILRHKAGSSVTREHYIQAVGSDVLKAMTRFEQSVGNVPFPVRSPADELAPSSH